MSAKTMPDFAGLRSWIGPPDRHHGWFLRRRGSRHGHHRWPVADGVRGARQRVLTPDVKRALSMALA
jgi:hypothetical protein